MYEFNLFSREQAIVVGIFSIIEFQTLENTSRRVEKLSAKFRYNQVAKELAICSIATPKGAEA
jgi:hypothetical protein